MDRHEPGDYHTNVANHTAQWCGKCGTATTIDLLDWARQYKHRLLTLGDSGGTVGIATVSPCGRYIAAVRPGRITIWNGVLIPDLESSAQDPVPVSN